MLKVEGLEVQGLKPVSFEVASGECLAVRGPSGSGKTLLLRAIADLDASEGLVFVDGAERARVPGPAWRRSVRYAAAEPGWWAETPRQHFADGERAGELAAALGLEPALLDRPVAQLSTGERQRLALVRSLLDEPDVLLLDEPTSALDAEATALAEKLIRRELKKGRAIVLVSHDASQARRLAKRRLVLGNGAARLEA